MRSLAGVVAAVILLLLIYFGSAASSLAKLAAAVRAGDGVAVPARTDLKTLNHSLTDQIVRSYLEHIGATRQIKPMERVLINTYGASIADAMVAKMLTPERLTQMLKTGSLDAPGVPSFAGLPALADLETSDWLSLIGRVKVIKPVLLAIRVSNSSEPDGYAAIDLHSEGLDWKLASIELPKPIVHDLAASLPVK
jgi:Protein of unknown function (DUF2939)